MGWGTVVTPIGGHAAPAIYHSIIASGRMPSQDQGPVSGRSGLWELRPHDVAMWYQMTVCICMRVWLLDHARHILRLTIGRMHNCRLCITRTAHEIAQHATPSLPAHVGSSIVPLCMGGGHQYTCTLYTAVQGSGHNCKREQMYWHITPCEQSM